MSLFRAMKRRQIIIQYRKLYHKNLNLLQHTFSDFLIVAYLAIVNFHHGKKKPSHSFSEGLKRDGHSSNDF